MHSFGAQDEHSRYIMIRLILRQQCLQQYSKLPASNELTEEYFFPKSLNSYILVSGFIEDVEKLSSDVSGWAERMGFDFLIFLGEAEMPWLAQESESKQVKRAFEFFKNQGINEAYNGGFIVDCAQLPEFFKHLFWLTRSNAAFPVVYFTDKEQGFVGNLCKYGNLHVFTITEGIDNIVLTVANKSLFKLADGMRC